jgi:membrane protease YdiL (CAAX protease family)
MAADRAPEGAVEPPRQRWGLGDVAIGFLAGLSLSSLVANVWLEATGDDELSLAGRALAQLGLWIGLVGVVVFASRAKGSGRLAADFGFRARPVDLLIGVVVGTAAHRLLIPALAFALRPILGEPDLSQSAKELFEPARGLEVVGLILFVAAGAPVVEELFFRGLLFRSLERRLGTGGGVVGSGVLFGLAHPQSLPANGLILAMICLAALGVVLAVLAVRTGRLGACIVAHAAFNAWTAAFILGR